MGTKIDQKPYRANWRLATDALGVHLTANILFSSKVLLVEGDSDPLYIYEMLRQLNQIGDLDVNPLKSSAPAWSNDANLFPGMQQKWGLSFDINTMPGPNGRSAGSYGWAGLLNCYYWVDPHKKLTGAMFTQLLPFYDARVVDLYGAFERGLYTGLASADNFLRMGLAQAS